MQLLMSKDDNAHDHREHQQSNNADHHRSASRETLPLADVAMIAGAALLRCKDTYALACCRTHSVRVAAPKPVALFAFSSCGGMSAQHLSHVKALQTLVPPLTPGAAREARAKRTHPDGPSNVQMRPLDVLLDELPADTRTCGDAARTQHGQSTRCHWACWDTDADV